MKRLKSLYIWTVGAWLLTACNVNEMPIFDDKDAFVAFTNITMSVDENVEGGELNIPVLYTSLAGLEGSVEFEIVDGKAKLGKDFALVNTDTKLQFTKDAPTQYITIRVFDNSTFGGDIDFTVNLKAGGLRLGDSQACKVTIVDDEHPLAAILGTYNGTGESYFGGALNWNLTLEKDEEDVTVVWISNIVPNGSAEAVYGIVNEEQTEIRIPVDQALVLNSDGTAAAQLTAIDPETENFMDTGSYIIGTIEDGTITINNAMYGSGLVEGGALTGSFYEIVLNGSVWTKQ